MLTAPSDGRIDCSVGLIRSAWDTPVALARSNLLFAGSDTRLLSGDTLVPASQPRLSYRCAPTSYPPGRVGVESSQGMTPHSTCHSVWQGKWNRKEPVLEGSPTSYSTCVAAMAWPHTAHGKPLPSPAQIEAGVELGKRPLRISSRARSRSSSCAKFRLWDMTSLPWTTRSLNTQ